MIIARIVAILSLAVLAGCATRPTRPGLAQIEAIRARVETQFNRAVYLKPSATSVASGLARQLAPLLIIEAPDESALPTWPGTNTQPRVFYQAGNVTLNGKSHQHMTFWWKYPNPNRRNRQQLPAQGVRITLNSEGRPALWEALADTSGAELIFVSQSVEAGAIHEFGPPVTGRRFVVERPVSEAPDTVVARVLEDGPAVMGPIIYLRADTHDVTTVICRCMDAQARELAAQVEYDLTDGGNRSSMSRSPGELETRLRLPKNF